ncbi:MAG: HAMP domain-containing sensor histidine kinase [Candidatus Margulisiibacteriota bacterium]|nr:HAMP domain-containing histidine kinase [Candidatus Margulisiibacteriota bacterium]
MEKGLIETNLELFQVKREGQIKESLLVQTLEQVEAFRKKIVELEKLRDDLTHMIIHDLKNPLSGIVMALSLLDTETLGELNGEQKKFVESSQIAAKKLTNMIMDLLEIRKMEDNKMTLQRSSFAAEELLKNLDWLKIMARKENKSLEFKVSPGLVIVGDMRILTRIVENLISNSIKHTSRGDRVVFRVTENNGRVLFEVIDSGEGIPKDALDKVFDRFFKVENQKLRTQLDTGLGLNFCKMAVEAHDGSICVESPPPDSKTGSRFYFYLPQK